MLSQNCGVKPIETSCVSHETAPGGYTVLIHDNADTCASTLYPMTQASAYGLRIAIQKS